MPFRYASPAISLNLIPSYGPIFGGNRIGVLGSNFDPISEFFCIFDVNGSQITFPGIVFNMSFAECLAPPIDSSAVTQAVTLGVSNNGADFVLSLPYIFYGFMQVTGILPSSGPISGGTSISILGSGFATGLQTFQDGFKCSFGEIFASAKIQSESTLTCISTANAVGRLNIYLYLDNLKIGDTMLYFEYYGEYINISIFLEISCVRNHGRIHFAQFLEAIFSYGEPDTGN